MKFIFSLFFILIFSSCASYFKRKTCESTNWFEYGQSVALEGRRLTGDQFVTECNQAEADVAEADLDRGFKSGLQKYCLPEVVFQTGKKGNFFNREMCIGEGLNNLTVRHNAGVLEYCQKSNGYSAGTVGKAYNKICPADLEKSFLPEFNRGRKKYLQALVSQNQDQISVLDRDVSSLKTDMSYKQRQLLSYNARVSDKDPNATNYINSLNSEINNLSYSIRSKQDLQNKLRSKNREIEIEMVQLGN